jgi:hypothetical protein
LVAVALEFSLSPSQGFPGATSGRYVQNLLPPVVIAATLIVLLVSVLHGRTIRRLWPWLAVAAVAFLTWPGHADAPMHRPVTWLLQVALVVPGLVLATNPLLADMRVDGADSPSRPSETVAGTPRTS